MNYNVIYDKDRIIIKDAKDFVPKHVFECGQCFRWDRKDDGSYTGVAYDKVINVKKEGEDIIISNSNMDDFQQIWEKYFDLDRDYGNIKKILSRDPVLAEAVKYGDGIRILNQDVWEILISFIISANNRIPMIKKAIKLLCERYGEYIEDYEGESYYSFPRPEILSKLSVEDLEKCKTGFRAKYILDAATIISTKQIDIYALKNINTEEARKNLMLFPGVGPKVSDCIMLFSLEKQDAFPIDIWVKRVMEYFYLKKDTKLKDIQKYAQDKFGEYAGFAQQYLFYYARELGIGKKSRRNINARNNS